MRILYDYQIFHTQKFGGVSKYFAELIKVFSSDDETEVLIPFTYTNNHYLLAYSNRFKEPPGINKRKASLLGSKKAYRWANNLFRFDEFAKQEKQVEDYIQKHDYDLFHPTSYNPYFLSLIEDKPFVLTIHDMIHEIYPEQFSPKEKSSQYKAKLASAAKHIIAVSENTKKDIIRILGVDEAKISVIHHGTNPLVTEQLERKVDIPLPPNYVLYIGARQPQYKNFDFFVRAMVPVFRKMKDLFLVCTGAPFLKGEIEMFKKAGIADKIQHIFVNEEDMPIVYKNSLLFVYPSLYEGFGIPILEAFQAECPVLLSNASCFPEVGDDAVFYFNPDDVTDLSEKIYTIINDFNIRQQLICKGKERIKMFTWEKTATQTMAVYKSSVV